MAQSKRKPNAKSPKKLEVVVPGVEGVTFQVDGKVASCFRAGVGGLRVQVVDKTVGDDIQFAEAITDEGGAYHASFTDADLRKRGKAKPDLGPILLPENDNTS